MYIHSPHFGQPAGIVTGSGGRVIALCGAGHPVPRACRMDIRNGAGTSDPRIVRIFYCGKSMLSWRLSIRSLPVPGNRCPNRAVE